MPTDTQLSNEVAIVMVGDQFLPRHNSLYRRNNQLKKLLKLIDAAMPYNILSFFGDGADGYHFNIKLNKSRN